MFTIALFKWIECINVSGRGVFAKHLIKSGCFVAQYAGELVTGEIGRQRENDNARPSCFRYFFKYRGAEYW